VSDVVSFHGKLGIGEQLQYRLIKKEKRGQAKNKKIIDKIR
jgi:hypothetical protein